MREVLEQAGIDAKASWVQASVGDFSLPLPIDEARESLLALMLNGEPIPQAHGAPVRLLVPGGECFTSVKWLARLEIRNEPASNTAAEIALRRIGRTPD
jgi:DMSO/TMAO reductase YedYZ molybdopterin-dependent catalytic subunit